MSNSILSKAIASCMQLGEGLRVAYIPAGSGDLLAEQVVREINGPDPATPPLAILVRKAGDDFSDSACVTVSPSSSLMYRQGDRILVVDGSVPEIESFIGSVFTIIREGYPDQTQGQVSFHQLAKSALTALVAAAHTSAEIDYLDDAVSDLESCLVLSAQIHRQFGQTGLPWNAQWFRDVEASLETAQRRLLGSLSLEPDRSMRDVLRSVLFSSFAIPRIGDADAQKGLAAKIHGALVEYWGDEEAATASAQHLRHHPHTPDNQHPLERTGFAGFNERIAVADNQYTALVEMCSNSDEFAEAVMHLTVSQLLEPHLTDHSASPMSAQSMAGADLSLEDTQSDPVYLLPGEYWTTENGYPMLVSEEVRIYLASKVRADRAAADQSKLLLKVPGRGYRWEGTLEVDADGIVSSRGRLKVTLAKSNPRYSFSQKRMTVSLSASDPLSSILDPTKSIRLSIYPPDGPALIYWEGSKNRARNISYLGPTEYDATLNRLSAENAYGTELAHPLVEHKIFAVNVTSEAVVNGIPMALTAVDAAKTSLVPSGLDTIEVDGVLFELRSAIVTAAFESPLEAAIYRQQVSPDAPASDYDTHALAVIEDYIAKHVEDAEYLLSLGHLRLPHDRDEGLATLFYDSALSSIVSPSIGKYAAMPFHQIPAELRDSHESRQFLEAFRSLGVQDLLQSKVEGRWRPWPSRVSWRHLYQSRRTDLERYLEAYVALIAKARDIGKPSGIFWASYPFSVSVWQTVGPFECRSVYLSPLHPVRLAWLASVEQVLWDAENAEHLAGVVEGWNFPIIGPRNTKNGRMVAVASDSGPGGLFVGWSTLVAASLDSPNGLSAPGRIGDLPAPGSAASGLNGMATRAAVRSYVRTNPQVTTLVVDLSSYVASARLGDLDEAVLDGVQECMSEPDSLPGGLRVFDSASRLGSAPNQRIADFRRSNPETPFVWKYYVPDILSPNRCNIRFLQDSGSQVSVAVGTEANRGILGDIPLRRFEVHTRDGLNLDYMASRPALSKPSGWLSFSNALCSVENSGELPEIQGYLTGSLVGASEADWTVSGEEFLNPSAIAQLLSPGANGSQMLWEWRPPYFDAVRGAAALQRRPFISVSKVPPNFRSAVGDLISKATDGGLGVEVVDDVFSTLGARGVGLSSLLAIGGTHAAGALGFYLSFKLIDQIEIGDAALFVLPLDACDAFLRALVGEKPVQNSSRRADLLVIALLPDEIVLVPLEVKCYGVDAGSPSFLPTSMNGVLREAAEQVGVTHSLLSSIVAKGASLFGAEEDADAVLWCTALATLVDVALRLNPSYGLDRDATAERLLRLQQGRLGVRAGSALVAYFGTTLTGAGESHAELDGSELGLIAGCETRALSANISASFSAIRESSHPISQEWTKLVRHAIQRPHTEGGNAAPRDTDPPDGGDLDQGPGHPRDMKSLRGRQGGYLAANELNYQTDSGRGCLEPTVSEDAGGDGVRFKVGDFLDSAGKAEAWFWPGNTELNQMNVGVVGDLGTGKTQLMQTLIWGLRDSSRREQAQGVSVLVFDYKEDFQRPEFMAAVGGTRLRPARIPLNIFALSGPYSRTAAYRKAGEFLDVISRIYPGVGPIQRSRLISAVQDLFEEGGGRAPTLAEVLARYEELREKPDALSAVLGDFVYGGIFEDDPSKLVQFEDLIEDKVLVIALKDLGTDQKAKNALVVLFLNMYYDYMLKLKKGQYGRGRHGEEIRHLNSFLLVDEAVNIMAYDFPVLEQILLQGREFGVGVILGSQFLSHFSTSGVDYAQPLLTWFVHKVRNVSVKDFQKIGVHGLSPDVPSRVAGLKKHEALYTSLGVDGRFIRDLPFFELLAEGKNAGEFWEN